MSYSAVRQSPQFEDFTWDCIYTGKKQTIVVHYIFDKASKEKKPRSFSCFLEESCRNRDKCPVWKQYQLQLKQQTFRSNHL